jgi:hypothetical protein
MNGPIARLLCSTPGLFAAISVFLFATHFFLLRLPYFWDEAGYYVPAARDLLGGSLIPHSTPSNAHPPLVMAWLALAWKVCGESQPVTRCAMLVLAAFSLTGFFQLARTVSNTTVAAVSTLLVAIYPVFFSQSSLAQVDLPAAGLVFWALEAYFRRRRMNLVIWFSLAALAKETAILVPIALLLWETLGLAFWHTRLKTAQPQRTRSRAKEFVRSALPLACSGVPLALWYAYHYQHTGFVFGNPEFLRYNLQGNLSPLRILLALLLRIWQAGGYLNLLVLTVACVVAMRYPAQPLTSLSVPSDDECPSAKEGNASTALRPRIDVCVQLAFLAITTVYLLAMSVLGGAVLARYMLPIVPLVILVCVSTIWRRLREWKVVIGIVAVTFVAAIFMNPPYGFAPEDNLAYRDYIRLHQRAETFIESRYPHAGVLTAWPASDELSRPNLGYVQHGVKVVRIEDFTAEQLLSAADVRSSFDVALVFSIKYQPPHPYFDHWRLWREWKTRYFGYHEDMTPEAAAGVLGGNLIYVERLRGQWVGVIRVENVREARVCVIPPILKTIS